MKVFLNFNFTIRRPRRSFLKHAATTLTEQEISLSKGMMGSLEMERYDRDAIYSVVRAYFDWTPSPAAGGSIWTLDDDSDANTMIYVLRDFESGPGRPRKTVFKEDDFKDPATFDSVWSRMEKCLGLDEFEPEMVPVTLAGQPTDLPSLLNNKGQLHSFYVFNMEIADVLGTFLGARKVEIWHHETAVCIVPGLTKEVECHAFDTDHGRVADLRLPILPEDLENVCAHLKNACPASDTELYLLVQDIDYSKGFEDGIKLKALNSPGPWPKYKMVILKF